MSTSLPEAFIFMKVGNHAGEDFEHILERKRRETQVAGRIFWGYGGNTLHPLQHVQPFARLWVRRQGSVHLVMEPMDSRASPEVLPATEFSENGISWEPIPDGISVIGSRYALVLGEIGPDELEFPLHEYEVGIGRSQGRPAQEYIKGRVDKGCFVRRSSGLSVPSLEAPPRNIAFTATMLEPYAVLLR